MQSENNPRVKKVDISHTQKFTLSVTANGIRGSGESFGGYFHAGGVPARPAPEPGPSSVPVTPAPLLDPAGRVPRPPHVCLARLVRLLSSSSHTRPSKLPPHCSHLFFCEKEFLIVACLLATCVSLLCSHICLILSTSCNFLFCLSSAL